MHCLIKNKYVSTRINFQFSLEENNSESVVTIQKPVRAMSYTRLFHNHCFSGNIKYTDSMKILIYLTTYIY